MVQSANAVERTVGHIDKGQDGRIVVKVGTSPGNPYVDIRLYWLPDGETDYLPTKKGVRFHAEFLPQMLELLTAASDELEYS